MCHQSYLFELELLVVTFQFWRVLLDRIIDIRVQPGSHFDMAAPALAGVRHHLQNAAPVLDAIKAKRDAATRPLNANNPRMLVLPSPPLGLIVPRPAIPVKTSRGNRHDGGASPRRRQPDAVRAWVSTAGEAISYGLAWSSRSRPERPCSLSYRARSAGHVVARNKS